MKFSIQTERLILREMRFEDMDGLFELDSDPEVHKYLGNNCVKDIEQVKKIVTSVKQQYIENGIGRWSMIDKKSGEFIGWTGLKLVKETLNGHSDFYDLGYRLLQKYWGKGLATESALASLKYGFETLNLEIIYASAHIDNLQSNRILNKIGFQFVETYPYESWTKNWYALSRECWLHINQRPQISLLKKP
jgi:ribosomal-protein-alanine N-acetyltransferase